MENNLNDIDQLLSKVKSPSKKKSNIKSKTGNKIRKIIVMPEEQIQMIKELKEGAFKNLSDSQIVCIGIYELHKKYIQNID